MGVCANELPALLGLSDPKAVLLGGIDLVALVLFGGIDRPWWRGAIMILPTSSVKYMAVRHLCCGAPLYPFHHLGFCQPSQSVCLATHYGRPGEKCADPLNGRA